MATFRAAEKGSVQETETGRELCAHHQTERQVQRDKNAGPQWEAQVCSPLRDKATEGL